MTLHLHLLTTAFLHLYISTLLTYKQELKFIVFIKLKYASIIIINTLMIH